MGKKEFVQNLRECFKDKDIVNVNDIATWVGRKSAIQARKYADEDGNIVLRRGRK